jgi:hypothetical protein
MSLGNHRKKLDYAKNNCYLLGKQANKTLTSPIYMQIKSDLSKLASRDEELDAFIQTKDKDIQTCRVEAKDS